MWFAFAKKGRWHEYLPVCIFASWLSLIVEAIMVYYDLWSYSGHPLLGLFVNGFGDLYKWTLAVIIFEYIHCWLGHISYHKWWNIGYSYLADWFLFWLFYKYHKFVTQK